MSIKKLLMAKNNMTYHEKIKEKAMKYDYYVMPVYSISQVDKIRRMIIKDLSYKFITMINHNDIYLLIFRKKNEK